MKEINDKQILLPLCNDPQTGIADLLTVRGGLINAIVGKRVGVM